MKNKNKQNLIDILFVFILNFLNIINATMGRSRKETALKGDNKSRHIKSSLFIPFIFLSILLKSFVGYLVINFFLRYALSSLLMPNIKIRNVLTKNDVKQNLIKEMVEESKICAM